MCSYSRLKFSSLACRSASASVKFPPSSFPVAVATGCLEFDTFNEPDA